MISIIKGAKWSQQTFKRWYDDVLKTNRQTDFGIVPRGFRRAIMLQPMSGPKVKRVPLMVVTVTKDELKALEKSISYGMPAAIACPELRSKGGGLTNADAWRITEGIHKYFFKEKKYSTLESFKVNAA